MSAGVLERTGSVLVVVMILVVLLALAAYSYTQLMISELSAARMYGRRLQTQAFADSGLEMAADLIGNRTFEPEENLIHNPEVFSGVSLVTGEDARDNGRFTLVAPDERDPDYKGIRSGLMSESGRFNINRLLALEAAIEEMAGSEDETSSSLEAPQLADLVAGIPGFDDQEVLDSILDWIDDDDDPRPMGAESSYYQGLPTPYEAKNGPLESMDELMQIRGITAAVLYGEDANRNGILDPNENDGDESLPSDNADGVLDLGLAGYCTVRSSETNLRADGADRINLNQGLMTELFDAVEEEFGEEVAQFVVAFRLYGSKDAAADEDGSGLTVGQEEAASAIGKAIGGDVEGTVTRAGLDLTQPAQFEYKALFDLIDAEVPAQVNGSPVTLISPWNSGSDLAETLPTLFDVFSLTDDALIDARIDPNYARSEVLMTIPDMTEEAAQAVVETSIVGPNGVPSDDLLTTRSTPGWLFTEGIVDLPTMRKIEPYLTTRGDIFRVQIVGFFDEGGPFTRLEAVIDGTESPAKIRSMRDLTGLGRGYTNEQLGLEPTDSGRSGR